MAGVPKKADEDEGVKIICRNRKARHLYQLLEEHEAGLVLTGTEVKSLREGHASLPESYAVIRENEAYLVGCHISEYTAGNRYNHSPVGCALHRHRVRCCESQIAIHTRAGQGDDRYRASGFS